MSPTSYQTAPPRGESEAEIIRPTAAYDNRTPFCRKRTGPALLQALSRLVRKMGLEPIHPKALPPQDSVSTNSTTSAKLLAQSSTGTSSWTAARGACSSRTGTSSLLGATG